MNKSTQTKLKSEPTNDLMLELFTQESHYLVELGKKHGWNFTAHRIAPMPGEPVQQGKWRIVPALQDSSPLPVRAQKRLKAIYAAGYRPKGFVLAHEEPNPWPTSRKSDTVKPSRWGMPALSPKVRSFLKAAVCTLGFLAIGLGTFAGALLAVIVAAFVAGAALLPLIFLGTLLMVDPILFAVTEEDLWVEIDRWDVPAN